jgi:hypothetical protein
MKKIIRSEPLMTVTISDNKEDVVIEAIKIFFEGGTYEYGIKKTFHKKHPRHKNTMFFKAQTQDKPPQTH